MHQRSKLRDAQNRFLKKKDVQNGKKILKDKMSTNEKLPRKCMLIYSNQSVDIIF